MNPNFFISFSFYTYIDAKDLRNVAREKNSSYLYRKRLMLILGVFSKGWSTVSILVNLL